MLADWKLESRKRVARFYTVLQTVAWAARPTGQLSAELRMQSAECRTVAFASTRSCLHISGVPSLLLHAFDFRLFALVSLYKKTGL